MSPRTVLRLEGVSAVAASVAAYVALDGPLWLFVVLALAPDLSMAGYFVGARAGSSAYNAAHTYVGPVALGAVGVWAGVAPAAWVALVWAAHIGADRAVGYGLKYPTGFGHTHLSRDGAAGATRRESEGTRRGGAGRQGSPDVEAARKH